MNEFEHRPSFSEVKREKDTTRMSIFLLASFLGMVAIFNSESAEPVKTSKVIFPSELAMALPSTQREAENAIKPSEKPTPA